MALVYAGGLTSTDFTAGLTGGGWQPQNFLYGGHVSIPSAGTVTQLGVYAKSGDGSAVTFKLGLFDSAGVLVAQSTTASITSTNTAWIASGAISATVSAGTYYVLVSASTVEGSYGYAASSAGSYADGVYASAMPSSVSTAGFQGETGQLYGVRLDFTAGGGGTAQDLAGAATGAAAAAAAAAVTKALGASAGAQAGAAAAMAVAKSLGGGAAGQAAAAAAAAIAKALATAAAGQAGAAGALDVTTGGTITTDPFHNGSVSLANFTIEKFVALRVSDMALIASWASRTSDGAGVFTMSDAAIVPGVDYLLVSCNADGSACGVRRYTAT